MSLSPYRLRTVEHLERRARNWRRARIACWAAAALVALSSLVSAGWEWPSAEAGFAFILCVTAATIADGCGRSERWPFGEPEDATPRRGRWPRLTRS